MIGSHVNQAVKYIQYIIQMLSLIFAVPFVRIVEMLLYLEYFLRIWKWMHFNASMIICCTLQAQPTTQNTTFTVICVLCKQTGKMQKFIAIAKNKTKRAKHACTQCTHGVHAARIGAPARESLIVSEYSRTHRDLIHLPKNLPNKDQLRSEGAPRLPPTKSATTTTAAMAVNIYYNSDLSKHSLSRNMSMSMVSVHSVERVQEKTTCFSIDIMHAPNT